MTSNDLEEVSYDQNTLQGSSPDFAKFLQGLIENPKIRLDVHEAALGATVSANYAPAIRAVITGLAGFYRQILDSKLETEKELGGRLGIQVKTLQNNRSAGVGIPFCKPFGPNSRPVRYHRLVTDAYIWQNCQRADLDDEK